MVPVMEPETNCTPATISLRVSWKACPVDHHAGAVGRHVVRARGQRAALIAVGPV